MHVALYLASELLLVHLLKPQLEDLIMSDFEMRILYPDLILFAVGASLLFALTLKFFQV
jgi:hypothetical protein